MLVLTREEGQKIIIGKNEVQLTVVKVSGKQVRLGFEAVSCVTIHREEIYNKVGCSQVGKLGEWKNTGNQHHED